MKHQPWSAAAHAPHHHHPPDALGHFLGAEVDLAAMVVACVATAFVVAGVFRFSAVRTFGYRGPRLRWTWGLALVPIAGPIGRARRRAGRRLRDR